MTTPVLPIAKLFQACEPNESLSPVDARYVNFDSARGDSPAPSHARSLRRADPVKPETKLLAGHRGIGKTSELLRLKALLEEPATKENPYAPFKVIFFDVNDSLDVNDLDFPDLLVLIAGEVQKQLKEAAIPGFTVTSAYFQRVWDDVKRTLGSNVELKDAEVEVPFGKLAVEFKNRPTARHLLREAIEKNHTSILAAVNDLLMQANVALRGNGLLREIPDAFWPSLRKFETPQADIPKDESHQQMLFYLHVFEYMNGEPWYEVNPVIRDLPKFKQP